MKLNKHIILGVVTAAMVLSVGGAALVNFGNQIAFGRAEPQIYGITFDSTRNKFHDKSGSTGYSGNAVIRTDLGNDVGFSYREIAGGPTSVWHYMKIGSYFSNTTPIHGLSSMTVASSAANAGFTVSWGYDTEYTLGSASYGFSSGNPVVDFGGDLPTYFRLENTGGSNFSISSMLVELTCLNNYPTLERHSENEEMGTVSGSQGAVLAGASVTVEATPKPGYRFDGWYDGDGERDSDSETRSPSPSYQPSKR